MGTWGTGIFDDDVAADVRAEYGVLREDGLTPAEATRHLVDGWSDAVEDADDGPTFWLALAAAQAEAGELVARVRTRALRVLAAGADLARRAPAQRAARKRALAALERRLRAPPARTPPPTAGARGRAGRSVRRAASAPPPPHPARDLLAEGDVVAYRLASGRTCLLRVAARVDNPYHHARPRRAPAHPEDRFLALEPLEWTGTDADADALGPGALAALPARPGREDDPFGVTHAFGVSFAAGEGWPAERLRHLARGLPARRPAGRPALITSAGIDHHLRVNFGLE